MINKSASASPSKKQPELSRAEQRTRTNKRSESRAAQRARAHAHFDRESQDKEHVLLLLFFLKMPAKKLNLLVGTKIISISVRSSFARLLPVESGRQRATHSVHVVFKCEAI